MLNFEFINKNIRFLIVCESTSTRNGFKHTAKLFDSPTATFTLKNGIFWNPVSSVKINYLNRTWEKYQFESVIFKLLKKFFKNDYKKIMENIGE